MKPKPKILVICGPTAVGKSDIAVSIARKFNGEIISADSRQIYKGLDIGSGKITKKEKKNIPHYLLDIASPKKVLTVENFQEKGFKIIKDILNRNKLPIICGGTGFYIQALAQGIVLPQVPPDLNLRKRLEKISNKNLLIKLKELDPKRTRTIDIHNKVRLIRAIEIAKSLGKVSKIKYLNPYKCLYIYLDLPDIELKKKIHLRLINRLKIGMIKEVEKLHQNKISWKRLESLGLEYRYISFFLQGKISKNEMGEKLEKEIWHYAKRQRTWFKKIKDTKKFKPKNIQKIEKEIREFIA